MSHESLKSLGETTQCTFDGLVLMGLSHLTPPAWSGYGLFAGLALWALSWLPACSTVAQMKPTVETLTH